MGSKSRSSNSTTNNTTNYSLQGMESASTVVAGNNNQVYSTTTDYGAIEGAKAISQAALDENSRVTREAIEAANKAARDAASASAAASKAAAKAAEDALKEGFAFGETAIELNGVVISDAMDLSQDSLERVSKFGESAIESNNSALRSGLDFAETLVQQNTANTANSTKAINELAKSVSTAGASDLATQSMKTVYTIGGVVVAVVLGALMIRGGK